MRRLFLVLVASGMLVSCTSPTGGSGGGGAAAVSGNAIINSLTMSPATTKSSARSLARSVAVADTTDTSYALAISNGLYPSASPNFPAILVSLVQQYVGSNNLPLNVTKAFSGVTVTSPVSATVSSSNIKITTSNTDVYIYWVFGANVTNPALGNVYLQVKLDLKGFTPSVYTDYTSATAWVDQYSDSGYTTLVNATYAINDFTTNTYSKYSPYMGSGHDERG